LKHSFLEANTNASQQGRAARGAEKNLRKNREKYWT
jgi:hypothetical protein